MFLNLNYIVKSIPWIITSLFHKQLKLDHYQNYKNESLSHPQPHYP